MNRTAALLLASIVVLFALSACLPQEQESSRAEPILKGEHPLRKMASGTDTESRMSASFFLVVGDVNATTATKVSVKFAWKMNDGIYGISSLPLERIRVQIDEKVEMPTVRFRWRRCNDATQLQEIMDRCVLYAVVRAKEKDWPIQVSLPLNQ